MSFKKNKLAACIAMAAVMPATAISSQVTDIKTPYVANTSVEQMTTFYVHLSQAGSLSKATLKNKKMLNTKLAKITKQQQKVIADIEALDGNIEVLSSAKIFGNFIRIQASSTLLNRISSVEGVSKVTAEMQAVSMPVNALASKVTNQIQNDDEIVIPALSEDANAGEGVKVAIIGTGVDYTHKSLGGLGTTEAYAEAMENAAAPFEGFPTEVVVGGLDLSSDSGWGLDENPIDQDSRCVRDYDGSTHNTGHGTRLASVVHELAPGAKLAAYKTSNVQMPDPNTCNLSLETSDTFIMALERAVDPKGDGSFEGRADVILIDSQGSNAFYRSDDDGISSPVAEILAIEMASSLGSLVVVNAGSAGEYSNNRFNLAWRGAAPSALTVGGMTIDGDSMKVTEKTPHGPVRGANTYTKPDMVTYAEQVGVAVVGSVTEMDKSSDAVMGAARLAAAAAIIKSKRPELSMIEVKALLMNTADGTVMNLASKTAELALIGNGFENMEAALASSAVAWEKGSYQPNLNFGFQEGVAQQRLVKNVQLKNLTDKTVTYEVAVHSEEKPGTEALGWEHPNSVSVPAGQTIEFPVILNVDFRKLDNWPINSADTFTSENWSKIELTGGLSFTMEEASSIKMNWLIKPRQSTEISRHFDTLKEDFQHPKAAEFDQTAAAYTQDFTNDSSTETTFVVFPSLYHADHKPVTKEKSRGNFPSDIGGGVYDEAQCTSGKKLVVASRFFDPNDAGMANHFDKGGAALLWWSTYQEQFVIDNGLDKEVLGQPYANEATDIVMSGFIEPDENQLPVAWYIDMNMEYDYTQPRARYKKSKLPTHISGHGQNVVAQYCLEDLYHNEHMNSIEDFDKNHGWLFATDRDAVADVGEPMIQYNPVKYGMIQKVSYFDWFTGEEQVRESNMGGLPLLSKPVAEGEERQYSPMLTLGPDESAQMSSISVCAFTGGLGVSFGCQNPGMMLVSLNDNWGMWSPLDTSLTPTAYVKDGQQHSVNEDANKDDLVATIELDAKGFFASADFESEWNPYELKMVNTLPGSPFILTPKGQLIVNNPEALDYDAGHREYMLEVIAKQGNRHVSASKVYININPINDIAPEVVVEFDAVTVETSESIEINAAEHFIDVEGDTLMYTATGLPEGVSIDASSGMITGSVSTAGSFEVTVVADDSVNKIEASFTMTVNAQPAPEVEQPKKKSSGSFGFGLIALAGLFATVRRRKVLK
ncbi:hypothetical protein SOPP22_17380 [Shewanella sp. OPT22]|nr:hypothetical protein SOPP22_17380 [Shewanella sp. OPT22]